jgi:hypothetical protein
VGNDKVGLRDHGCLRHPVEYLRGPGQTLQRCAGSSSASRDDKAQIEFVAGLRDLAEQLGPTALKRTKGAEDGSFSLGSA